MVEVNEFAPMGKGHLPPSAVDVSFVRFGGAATRPAEKNGVFVVDKKTKMGKPLKTWYLYHFNLNLGLISQIRTKQVHYEIAKFKME